MSTHSILETWKSTNLIACRPPKWLTGGHRQTLGGHLIPSPVLRANLVHHEIPLPDGERLSAWHYEGTSHVVVSLFHGLGGHSHTGYMQRTAQLAIDRGHSVFMVNHRGCGEGHSLAIKPYHSGRAEDLSAAIEYAKKMYPNSKHLAIGFSLSANALLLLAAGQRGKVQPDFAIAVNGPVDLGDSSRQLKAGLNRVYDLRFINDMRKLLAIKRKQGDPHANIHVSPFRTIYEFDALYTAPAGGFRDREEYYATCSAKNYFKDISIPTFILTAADDPFIGVHHYRDAKLSELAHLHIEEFGGHLGYYHEEKTPFGSRRWLDYTLDRLIEPIR